MTPGARIKSAIELLEKIEATHLAADMAVNQFLRGRRYVGSKDRRYLTNFAYGCLRQRARLDWWLRHIMPGKNFPNSTRARIIASLMLENDTTLAGLGGLFNGGRHCPAPLSETEVQLAQSLEGRSLDHPEMPPWVAHETPEWVALILAQKWGEDLPRQLAALNQEAQVVLRVNSARADRQTVLKSLQENLVNAQPTPLSPLGVVIDRRVRLSSTDAYQKGWIEVQDEGSQIIALLSDARPGMTVIDFCAGAGGKALALSAAMRGRGHLICCDVSGQRLDKLEARKRRAGADNLSCLVLTPQLDNLPPAASADRVLLDVPCSGTGVWRRNPAAKWELTPVDLQQHLTRQRAILETAHTLVKPGGQLIYATCSLLPHENEDQVTHFIEQHPNFASVPVASLWPSLVSSSTPYNETFLNLTPADHGCDGFFAAVLQRQE